MRIGWCISEDYQVGIDDLRVITTQVVKIVMKMNEKNNNVNANNCVIF